MQNILDDIPVQTIGSGTALVVDLDNTLIRTDLLLESLLVLIKQYPLSLFLLPLWLFRGRAHLKEQLAARTELDVVSLPYRASVLEQIKLARSEGRKVVLATASHRKFAEKVANHLGLFDAVLATDGGHNLKGGAKVQAIQQYLSGEPFDYIGDSAADLPIWQACRRPILVGASQGVIASASRPDGSELVLHEPRRRLRDMIKMMRVHQWLKNLLVFVPFLAAHQFSHLDGLVAAVTGFFAFSLCASSVYVLNDLFDLESDRHHARKRKRALASGAVPITYGFAAFPSLLAASLALSLTLPWKFQAVMALYYISTLIYTFWAKKHVIVDVIMLAGLYSVRLLAGSAATGIEPSFWLLALSDFIFLSLALVKRYSELVRLAESGATVIKGRGYRLSDMPGLQTMGIASGFCSVMVMALYINSPDILSNYSHPKVLWVICPMLLFWLARIWMKTNRGMVDEDPVVFAATDRESLAIGATCLLAMFAGNW